jgi:hypothetical protein
VVEHRKVRALDLRRLATPTAGRGSPACGNQHWPAVDEVLTLLVGLAVMLLAQLWSCSSLDARLRAAATT